MPKVDSFDTHENRRNQTDEERRKNIEDGLRAEKTFASLVIDYGLGLILPPKVGDLPFGDSGDAIVQTATGNKYSWSIKATTMKMPVVCVCADQIAGEKSDNYAFFFIRDRYQVAYDPIPLGWVRKRVLYKNATPVQKGELIHPDFRYTAQYDMIIFPVSELNDIRECLDKLTKQVPPDPQF